jgi:hypothetical protein
MDPYRSYYPDQFLEETSNLLNLDPSQLADDDDFGAPAFANSTPPSAATPYGLEAYFAPRSLLAIPPTVTGHNRQTTPPSRKPRRKPYPVNPRHRLLRRQRVATEAPSAIFRFRTLTRQTASAETLAIRERLPQVTFPFAAFPTTSRTAI